jgi:hypothetical protein
MSQGLLFWHQKQLWLTLIQGSKLSEPRTVTSGPVYFSDFAMVKIESVQPLKAELISRFSRQDLREMSLDLDMPPLVQAALNN